MKRTPIEICHYLLQLQNLHSQWQFKTMIQALCNVDLLSFKMLVNATPVKLMPCKAQLLNVLVMCKSKHDFVNLQITVNEACAKFQLNIQKQYPILQANSEQDWLQMQNDMQQCQSETEQSATTFKTGSEVIVDTEYLHATEEVNESKQVQETKQDLKLQKKTKRKRCMK